MRTLNQEKFFETLVEIAEYEPPDMAIFKVYMKYFHSMDKGMSVCLTSVIEPDYDFVISLEEKAEKYGVLPNAGGWFDQSNMLVECFECIRKARIEYERDYYKTLKETKLKK